MKQLTFRLKPGQFLKEEIKKIVEKNNIKAGILLSIVGSLKKAVLRMAGSEANNQIIKEWNELFEIVSGTGTVSKEGCHIHISLSDKNGNVIGGHLKDGCVINSTAEIIIGILDDVSYKRVYDKDTGFKELNVELLK